MRVLEACWQHYVYDLMGCALPWDEWTWVKPNQTCVTMEDYVENMFMTPFLSSDSFQQTIGCPSLCHLSKYILSSSDSFVSSYFEFGSNDSVKLFLSYLSKKVSCEVMINFPRITLFAHLGGDYGRHAQLRFKQLCWRSGWIFGLLLGCLCFHFVPLSLQGGKVSLETTTKQ